MTAQRTYVTDKTGTLGQRLRSTGSETTLTVNVTEAWTSVTTGKVMINEGSSAEWAYFTGVTTVSATEITLTGVTRGLDKDATSDTDATSTNKKDHAVGKPVRLVLHSHDINTFVQEDRDNTISGTNSFTGTNTFSSTTLPTMVLQSVTTSQRDALSPATEGAIVRNSTTGTVDVYLGGAWVQFAGTAATVNASTTVAGKVEIATSAELIAMTATGGTGAILVPPNDATERLLNGMHNSTTTQLRLGYNNTGSRVTELDFISDATYTSGGFIINRAANGANSITSLTHRGTSAFTLACTEGGVLNIDTTGGVRHNTEIIKAYTAGETLVAGDWVYFKAADSRVWKVDRTALASGDTLGNVRTGGAAGATVYVQEGVGTYTGLSGLTAGSSHYSSGTPGAITTTVPTMNSATVFPFYNGLGSTTTILHGMPQRLPRRLFGCATVAQDASSTTITVGFTKISHVLYRYAAITASELVSLHGSGTFDAQGTGTTQTFITAWAGASEAPNTGTHIANAGSNVSLSLTGSIYWPDTVDGTGHKLGSSAVSGTDVVITWTDSNWNAGARNLLLQYEIYEQL